MVGERGGPAQLSHNKNKVRCAAGCIKHTHTLWSEGHPSTPQHCTTVSLSLWEHCIIGKVQAHDVILILRQYLDDRHPTSSFELPSEALTTKKPRSIQPMLVPLSISQSTFSRSCAVTCHVIPRMLLDLSTVWNTPSSGLILTAKTLEAFCLGLQSCLFV